MQPDEAEPTCATFTHSGYAKTRDDVIVECTLHGQIGSVTGEKKRERAIEVGREHERQRT